MRENKSVPFSVVLFCLLLIAGLFLFSNRPTALGQNVEPGIETTIKETKDAPENYLDKKVVVKGRLKIIGEYFGEHFLVLEDELGNRVVVTPWAPYEMIPSTSKEFEKRRPKTMSYYLDKELSIKGRVKFQKGERPKAKAKHYIEVESAVELQGK